MPDLQSYNVIRSVRGLGRIWATGCVKFWLATLAIHSFSPHLQPKKQICSKNIQYWVTFVAQIFKKPKNKQQKNPEKC